MYRRTLLAGFIVAPAIARAAGRAPLKVVATFSVLGDMVTQLAGDKVHLVVIVGPDGDTEAYEPTAADARALADADLLVMNGLNTEFEPWLDGLIKQSGFRGTKLVASDGVRTLKKAEEAGGHEAKSTVEIDQHAWHDAANAAQYASNIGTELIRLDAGNADMYRARLDVYHRELLDLDGWAKKQIGSVPKPKRKVITSHDGFAYLGRAYDITIIGARGWTNEKEPTAAQVAALIRQIKQDRIHAIFIENMNDPRLVERIAQETGATVGGELFSDALSKPGEGSETYVKMFRHNVEVLRAGMMQN